MVVKGKKANKNPPILSQEFFIKNHADIIACIVMALVVGVMFQVTSSVSSHFVSLQHEIKSDNQVVYRRGIMDLCNIIFCTLLIIASRAAIQEYILDKITKKLHLSKSKHSQFDESGHLLILYTVSIIWAGDIILKNNFLVNVSLLWSDYPQRMTFSLKVFLIIQMSYWINCYPQLYLQKTKRSEIFSKIKIPTLFLVFIATLYVLNFSRIGIVLIFLSYWAEAAFHASRMFHIIDKEEKNSKTVEMAANVIFLVVSINATLVTLLTFLYGFSLEAREVPSDLAAIEDNYNTFPVRLFAIALIFSVQGYLLSSFGKDSIKQLKNLLSVVLSVVKNLKLPSPKKPVTAAKSSKGKQQSAKKKKDRKPASDNELTEADQNTKKSLKNKRVAKAK